LPVPTIGNESPKLTLENIAKILDDDLENAALGQANSKIDYNLPTEKERVAALSEGEKIIYLTTGLEGEIYNGGFHQYFCNTNGELAIDTIEAYRKIGADKHAELVTKATELAAKEEDLRESIRASKDRLKAFCSSYKQTKLDDLDDVFYALEKEEITRALRADYIRKNANDFVEK
jgi:hypothetical protein